MRRPLLLLAAVTGCASNTPSPIEQPTGSAAAGADPWSASTASHASSGAASSDDDKPSHSFGGFDLQGILSKVKDSIDKPGPYEAPEQSADYDASKPHMGVMKLGGDIVEREAFSITGGHGTELRTVIDRLRDLAKDDKLTGLLLRVGDIKISLPDAVELRAAMHDFRAAGKKLPCHAEGADNATYLVLAACDHITLAPLGDVMIPGPAAMPIHIKGLLDKLGITADFLHVGDYKGAAEPLTRDAPSKFMEETLGAILDRRFQSMVEIISADRHLDAAAVPALIDTAMFPADAAKDAKLVDDVGPYEAARAAAAPWVKIDLEPDKGNQLAQMMKLARFFGAMPPDRPTGDHIAVVYAVGNIIDGKGDGVLGARGEIAAQTLVPALDALAADDSVKAVVLRVDSGGGSAQASELIWRAVARLRAKKPVIVSMSDVAASGGYYISSGATKIFALPDTLTGSIGVVGGKIAPGGALEKIGVTTFPMGRGKRATMWVKLTPWTDDEKHAIQETMDAVYKVFVGRVADGRKKTPEQVQAIAQGRVWTGEKAKEIGLVDELGGLDAALAEARTLGKVSADTELEVYPPGPTLRDVLVSFGQVQAPLGLGSHVELAEIARALDPDVAAAAERMVDLVMSFRAAAVQTVAIVPVLR
jgi:protease-4